MKGEYLKGQALVDGAGLLEDSMRRLKYIAVLLFWYVARFQFTAQGQSLAIPQAPAEAPPAETAHPCVRSTNSGKDFKTWGCPGQESRDSS